MLRQSLFRGALVVMIPALGGLFLVGCSEPVVPPEECLVWPRAPSEFAVGILTGASPFSIIESHSDEPIPVLTGADIQGMASWFVADPFLSRAGDRWYLFFEVLDTVKHKGVIGLAESKDGVEWLSRGTVLEEPYHLSYPHVFESEGQHYMVPEGHQGGAVRLYRANDFPYDWTPIAVITTLAIVDCSLFQYHGLWWMFGTSTDNNRLHLLYSDRLLDGWREHPASPVISGDRARVRQGGRVFEADGKLWRVAQDCVIRYGNKVNLFEILELTTGTYRERAYEKNPIFDEGDYPWAQLGMHHFDVQPVDAGSNRWLAVTDGYGPAQPEHYLDVQFENGIRLGGVTLRPERAVPGGTCMMRFYWDVPLTNPPLAFVHFVQDEELEFQLDHAIHEGERPSYDYHNGLLPADMPVGEYEIWCGLLDTNTQTRIPLSSRFKSDKDAVRLPVRLTVVADKSLL